MSHWAEIDQNNKVIRVLVGDNNEIDEGYEWLIEKLGGTWIKTSYNAATNGFRKNFAGVGYEYREDIDAFVAPQPFASWTLDNNAQWQPPIARPNDNNFYVWNETEQNWDLTS